MRRIGPRYSISSLRPSAARLDMFEKIFLAEKEAWGIYYDTLERIEAALKEKDPFALALKEEARALVQTCEINLDENPHNHF